MCLQCTSCTALRLVIGTVLLLTVSEVLCEHIGRIVSPFDIKDLHLTLLDSVSNKMESDEDMFCMMFCNRVVFHEDGPLVVTTDWYR